MRKTLPGLSVLTVLLLAGCVQSNSSTNASPAYTAPSGSVGPNSLNVADAAIKAGDPSMALSVSQSILSDHPDNVEALVHEGDAYYALGRCPASEAAYQLALQHDPRSSPAETGLARCQLKTNPAAAEASLEQAVTDDPGNADALNDLGIARDLQGNFAGAVDPYQKALLADPQLTGAEVNLGLSLALAGNGPAALQYLGPLATGQDATPKIREDYAAALVASGRQEEARQVLAIDLPPDQVNSALAGFEAIIAQGQSGRTAPPPPEPTQATVTTAPVTAAPEPVTTASTTQPTPLMSPTAPASQVSTPAPAAPDAGVPYTSLESTPATSTAPAPADATTNSSDTGPEVQLAALNSNDAAQHAWDHLSSEYPALFGSKTPDIQEAVVRGKTYYRLRVGGFDSRADAAKFCGEVLAAGKTCTVANFK